MNINQIIKKFDKLTTYIKIANDTPTNIYPTVNYIVNEVEKDANLNQQRKPLAKQLRQQLDIIESTDIDKYPNVIYNAYKTINQTLNQYPLLLTQENQKLKNYIKQVDENLIPIPQKPKPQYISQNTIKEFNELYNDNCFNLGLMPVFVSKIIDQTTIQAARDIESKLQNKKLLPNNKQNLSQSQGWLNIINAIKNFQQSQPTK